MARRFLDKLTNVRAILVSLGVVALTLALAVDLYRFIRARDLGVTAGPFGKSDQFHGDVHVIVKQIDHTRNRVIADVTATVRSLRPTSMPNTTIHTIAVMLLAPSEEGSQILVKAQGLTGFTREMDRPMPDGKLYSTIVQSFPNVEIPFDAASAEEIYPFDTTVLTFSPGGCVNGVGSECPSNSPKRMTVGIRVELDDQVRRGHGLRLRGDKYLDRVTISIGRHSFIRISAVYFMVLAAVILFFLYHQQNARDLMIGALGLLGGLWGFRQVLVPGDVKIFPTLVDYFVLFSFGLVFLLVINRLSIKGEAP